MQMTEKRCPKCGETKKANEFYRDRSSPDGLQGRCRRCHREAMNESRAKKTSVTVEAVADWLSRMSPQMREATMTYIQALMEEKKDES